MSFNFAEKNVEVCVKLCKNENACDVIDDAEIEVFSTCMELLIEMNQGPCENNQQFISVSGIVEVIQKIMKAKFIYLIKTSDNNPYPPSVRRAKELIMLFLLSMLETRR